VFIREYKTKNKKTNSTYITHRLVQSIQTEKGPRQRIIMNLGSLLLPKSEWKKLAYALDSKLTGQVSLLENEAEIERIATKTIEHSRLVQNIKENEIKAKKNRELLTIDLKSVRTRKNRTLGPELVGDKIWKLLDFDAILTECGFDKQQLALSKAVIIGRLVSPGSDLSTYKWFQSRSSLNELLHTDLANTGKDKFYEIVDDILSCKRKIEKELRLMEKEIFPRADSILFYDLTNTYFEGSCLENSLAEYGKCKSHRTDCPLVTLALVVDSDGFPIISQIYKGNQSEPETFEGILRKLEKDISEDQISLIKPTIVMDRGIATKDNIKLLKQERYPYIVIERRETESEYEREFKKAKETFEKIEADKKSAYGDRNHVYVKKIEHSEDTCRILCLSEGKERKERAIDSKKEVRFTEDLKQLNQSIEKGSVKKIDKVVERVGRIKERHSVVSQYYNITIQKAENERVAFVNWTKIDIGKDETKLYGCYVIETTHKELDAKHIWKLYMTLTRVESAFRALKSELGFRPVYHHGSERTEGHLFISLLAYHMLNAIEKKLTQKGDTRSWITVRDVLSTHQRNTVVMTAEDGSNHHYTVSSEVESEQQKIYDILGVKDPLKPLHNMAKFSL
jgi:transposase